MRTLAGLFALASVAAAAEFPISIYEHVKQPGRRVMMLDGVAQPGRSYRVVDRLGEPRDFVFAASNNLGIFEIGDRVPLFSSTKLALHIAGGHTLKLLCDGETVAETKGVRLEHTVKGPAACSAQVFAGGELWIESEPIRLEKPNADTLRLPSSQLDAAVEAHRDIAYIEGDETAKHKLDVYRPKQDRPSGDGPKDRGPSQNGPTQTASNQTKPSQNGPQERTAAQGAPVFLFIHGGSWRSGDRSQYPALGNRFAKAGAVVVVPSYRLAPAALHPAQAEDVAAALAWTVKHAAEYGGDPGRIYLGGHSAGGHLAALVALDPKYLAAHQLKPSLLKGVIAMSGVYDVQNLENVFGKDPAGWPAASPQTYIRRDAPPFIVTYCQWDYATLPAQARQFHAALREAGAQSELVYVPAQNHISEVINMVADGDLTAQSVFKLIGTGPVADPKPQQSGGSK